MVSIGLLNYDNPGQKHFGSWVPDHSSDLQPFDESKASRLKELNSDAIEDFVDDLCEYHILYKYYTVDAPNGVCIKLNYSNGEFLIINNSYIGKFLPDGQVADFIGDFSHYKYFEYLVSNYFKMQV